MLRNSYQPLKNLQKILAKNNSNLKVLQKGLKIVKINIFKYEIYFLNVSEKNAATKIF